MSRHGLVRQTAAVAGVAVFIVLFMTTSGAGGMLAGFASAGTIWLLGERYWRRRATAEERQAELEDRVRNPPS